MLTSNYYMLTLEDIRWIERRIPVYGILTGDSGYGLVIHTEYGLAILDRKTDQIVDSQTALVGFYQQEIDTNKTLDVYIPMWSLTHYCVQIKEAIKDFLFNKAMKCK